MTWRRGAAPEWSGPLGEETQVERAVRELRDRRARLAGALAPREPRRAGALVALAPCPARDALDEVLRVAEGAEAQLLAAAERTEAESSGTARLAAVALEVGPLEAAGQLEQAIPALALRVCPGTGAVLLRWEAGRGVEVVARRGRAFERRVVEEVRAVAGDRTPRMLGPSAGGGDDGDFPLRGHVALVPIARGAERLVLALAAAEVGPALDAPALERLVILASLVGAALACGQARAALRQSAGRDAAAEQPVAQRMVGSVARYTFEQLAGASPALLRVVEEARRVAGSEVPVLVCGESGTGKEVLAQAIHNASARSEGPFLGINVTAIPRELLESELFGYEGGTFTGARASGRAGKFELAGRGTLLLDEIGDMPLEMQSRLLRVLQERVVQRLGSARDIPIRARIIATTSRDLGEAVEQGRFRLDLYHRLRVVQLDLPPLRERQGDVALLVDRHLASHAEATRRWVGVAPHVREALERYPWPGNVRELQNVLEGELSVLPPGQAVLARIPPVLLHGRAPVPRAAGAEVQTLEEAERQACERALAASGGNVAWAARTLGVAKGTLYAKMRRYGLGALPGPGAAPLARPGVSP